MRWAGVPLAGWLGSAERVVRVNALLTADAPAALAADARATSARVCRATGAGSG